MLTRMRFWSRSNPALASMLCVGLFAAACSGGGSDDTTETTVGGSSQIDGSTPGGSTTTLIAGEIPPATPPDGLLTIGALLPESGSLAFLHDPLAAGIDLAIADVNNAGGVLGKPVQLVPADSGSDRSLGATAAATLIGQNGVDAIVGSAASGITETIMSGVVESPTLMCSPSNFRSSLSDLRDNGLYFRTSPSDDLHARASGELVAADGHKRVAIVAPDTELSARFSDIAEATLEERGVTVVDTVFYSPSIEDYEQVAQQIVDADIDGVLLLSKEEGYEIIRLVAWLRDKELAEEEGVEAPPKPVAPDEELQAPTTTVAPTVVPEPTLVAPEVTTTTQAEDEFERAEPVAVYITDDMFAPGRLAEVIPERRLWTQIFGTQPAPRPTAEGQDFTLRMSEQYPQVDELFSAHALDCIVLVALAAQATGSDDPKVFGPAMIAVSSDGEQCFTFSDCVEKLNAGVDINYEGASGPIDFDSVGDPRKATFEAFHISDDGTFIVDREVVVEAPLPTPELPEGAQPPATPTTIAGQGATTTIAAG